MSKITVWFIKSALVYFFIAALLGVHMVAFGTAHPYLPIHVHLNLLGWMSMMIYGVAYHILPRFSGRPLYSDRLAQWQLWLANIGLIGMTGGWFIKTHQGDIEVLLLASIIESLAIAMFILNIFMTVRAAEPAGR